MRNYLLVIASLLLSACTASGPAFDEASLASDSLVIYRPSGVIGAAGIFTVNVNGTPHCELHNASYYVDKTSGHVALTASRFMAPGTTKLEFDKQKNRQYFVRMEDNTAKSMSVATSGYVGMMIADGLSSNSGPYIFTLVDPEQAKQELKGLRLENGC